MSIDALTIIGEKLNYSIPRIKTLMDNACESGNFSEIQKIAQKQEEKGVNYLDINVGTLPIEIMQAITKAVQEVTNLPLCFDSDDFSKLRAGLEVYNYEKSLPILNSANETRINNVLSLKKEFQLILLSYDEKGKRNYEIAKNLFRKSLEYGFKPDQLYIDPGMVTIAADMEGLTNVALNTIKKVNSDPEMKGVHTLVGLSNLTYGMPPKSKLPFQNAFLTLAIERGLDTIIGNSRKKYNALDESDQALIDLKTILKLENPLIGLVATPTYNLGRGFS